MKPARGTVQPVMGNDSRLLQEVTVGSTTREALYKRGAGFTYCKQVTGGIHEGYRLSRPLPVFNCLCLLASVMQTSLPPHTTSWWDDSLSKGICLAGLVG